jgi:O-antigen ligase
MRLSSIQLLISGDLTAGGTLQRLDVRMPKVMNKFWESPIIGWGFSNGFQEYKDGHVGHANILLNIGLLGYVFINIIYLKICIKTKKIIQNREVLMKEGRAPLVYLFGLFSIFIIHSSSTQFWGYDMFYSQIPKILLLSFIFSSMLIGTV